MGDVIRSKAAVEAIFKDAQTTHANAVAKGGDVKKQAEEGLGPVVTMIEATESDLKAARAVCAPLISECNAENDRADAEVDRIYDEVWNDVARPANDRWLALMYPGGAGYYTDGDTPGQPARMELLARFFDRKLHPKLTAAQSQAYAARVRTAAAALKVDIDAMTAPAAEVALLERVRTSLGRVAQFELASLKRTYKNAGMSEAQIHAIIPDRPAPKKAPKKEDGKPNGDAAKPVDGVTPA